MPTIPPVLQAAALTREAGEWLQAGQKALDDRRTEDATRALQTCETKAFEALRICRQFGVMGELTALGQLSAALMLQKKYAQARQAWQQRLELAERTANLSAQQDSLEAIGRTCLELEELAEARRCYQRALELFEERRTGLATEADQVAFTAQGLALYERLLMVCMKLGKVAEALEVVEQTKSRALLSLLGTASLRQPSMSAALMQRESRLLEQLREVVSAWHTTGEQELVNRLKLRHRWVGLRQKLEQVWQEMAADTACAEYVALRLGTAPNLVAMRACLG